MLVPMSRSVPARLLFQEGDVAVDPPGETRVGGAAAAVGLHADHRDDLAAAGDQFGEPGGIRPGNGPGFGPDALGKERDRLGIERIGLGQAPHGPGEVADLARVDDTQRQPGTGERGRDGRLEAAGGLEHDQRDGQGGKATGEIVETLPVAGNGECFA